MATQVTLGTNFCIPFLREFWLRLGICSADRKTFQSVLSQKGRGIAVVVGGAAESLKAAPGTLDLYLARRKGFVRQVRPAPRAPALLA
jgi:2-acylglycerol O-acyltransferase 2